MISREGDTGRLDNAYLLTVRWDRTCESALFAYFSLDLHIMTPSYTRRYARNVSRVVRGRKPVVYIALAGPWEGAHVRTLAQYGVVAFRFAALVVFLCYGGQANRLRH